MEENSIDEHNSQNSNHAASYNDQKCKQNTRLCSNEFSQISREVDRFIDVLLDTDDKVPGLGEAPDFVNAFLKNMESRILIYNSGEAGTKFGEMAEEESFFMESVRRTAKLANALREFQNIDCLLNQTAAVLQRAVVFLEEEFRALLENSRLDCGPDSKNLLGHFESNCPAFSPEVVAKLREIASTMISSGHEVECSQVYLFSRRIAISSYMIKLDFNVALNMDDVAKMPWESLQIEISRWINVVKTCSQVIFPGERTLVESVFPDSPPVRRSLLSNIVSIVVIQLLDFAEASVMAKRSAEKLFKYLDMYEALQNLIPAIGDESCSEEVIDEVTSAADRIGESAASIFCDLENSIKSDVARTPVPGGAVHPLTRYVMNYLKYACEYKGAFEKILGNQTEMTRTHVPVSNNPSSQDSERESESPNSPTPFSIQVLKVMDLLDANLDRKSKLYKDPPLHYIFLMNNGRYILQKVKGSTEIRQVLGDTWCRRRSTEVRQYHKNYQRETWNRVLQCLNQDGLMVNGKVNKPLLKERLKIFTTVFEEIHRTQGAWVVSDEQLQSELKISISAVVIPAYRSFVGRFRHHFNGEKHVEKYIKYQPEDLETLIEGLFTGSATSTPMKKS